MIQSLVINCDLLRHIRCLFSSDVSFWPLFLSFHHLWPLTGYHRQVFIHKPCWFQWKRCMGCRANSCAQLLLLLQWWNHNRLKLRTLSPAHIQMHECVLTGHTSINSNTSHICMNASVHTDTEAQAWTPQDYWIIHKAIFFCFPLWSVSAHGCDFNTHSLVRTINLTFKWHQICRCESNMESSTKGLVYICFIDLFFYLIKVLKMLCIIL